MTEMSLAGLWAAELEDGRKYEMRLPGTLDENGIGDPDLGKNQWHPDAAPGAREDFDPAAPIATRFTRKHTYEGAVRLTRTILYELPKGKRVFLDVERARCLKVFVDGQEVSGWIPPSLSSPRCYELTGMLQGEHELTLISDNGYPGLPHDAIVNSSAATDETQTNWNGVLGYLRLREEEENFIASMRVYPQMDLQTNSRPALGKNVQGQIRTITVYVEIASLNGCRGELTIDSDALLKSCKVSLNVPAGRQEICLENLPLAENVRYWDEMEGCLYEVTARLTNASEYRTRFGVRSYGYNAAGRLTLNGRVIFLRSEANCAVFPEEGHPPMETNKWRDILQQYQAYGVNCIRFHSHCPPEEAFAAADELGMLMQPELSHWDPHGAFETEESWNYYRVELEQILRTLANHPSFVMLTLGNELWSQETGTKRMTRLLELAKGIDNTRLYANASNGFYGTKGCDAASDFYTSQSFYEDPIRGTRAAGTKGERIQGYINNQYPNACTSYEDSMKRLRESYSGPVFSFEVGQFEVLPDFDELEEFHGVTVPVNYELIRKKAAEVGVLDMWKRYVEATGELSRIGYREEIEAAMRTEALSGISLLGLQDFPGQGTALVGMMNAHLEPKPYAFAEPERFAAFFRRELVLVGLPRYTFEQNETLEAVVTVANYGTHEINAIPQYEVRRQERDGRFHLVQKGDLQQVACPAGGLTDVGTLRICFAEVMATEQACRLELYVRVGAAQNTYPIWCYPPQQPVLSKGVYETERLDEEALSVLSQGGTVYLSPYADEEHLPHSIPTQFTTDFWSVGTFPAQAGGMGQLIDAEHPLFRDFPTEFYTNWQWWPMATQRAIILPRRMRSIVEEMDSYAYMRPMTQLLECRCGGGKLLLSSMGLQNLQQYPEARALQCAVYNYLAGEEFAPDQEMEIAEIQELVPLV